MVAVTCCSTVSITNSRCDLCAGTGSRVECGYTIIRDLMLCIVPQTMRWRMGLASVYYAMVKAGGWMARECQAGKQY